VNGSKRARRRAFARATDPAKGEVGTEVEQVNAASAAAAGADYRRICASPRAWI